MEKKKKDNSYILTSLLRLIKHATQRNLEEKLKCLQKSKVIKRLIHHKRDNYKEKEERKGELRKVGNRCRNSTRASGPEFTEEFVPSNHLQTKNFVLTQSLEEGREKCISFFCLFVVCFSHGKTPYFVL